MSYVQKTQRFGLLLPSSNSTQEPEFIQTLPPNVSLHCARLTLSNIDPDSTIKIVQELEAETTKLSHVECDAVVLSATAPSTRMGKGYDQEICKRIEAALGKPATTAATAMLQAFAALKIQRIVLAAPWSAGTNQTVANFIDANGVQVLHQESLGIVSNLEVGRLDPQTAFDLGRKATQSSSPAVTG